MLYGILPMMQEVLIQQYFSEEGDESVLRMASLILQERMLTEECGGVFPELETSFSTIHRILDAESEYIKSIQQS
jgi:hypothetical protein